MDYMVNFRVCGNNHPNQFRFSLRPKNHRIRIAPNTAISILAKKLLPGRMFERKVRKHYE